MVKINTFIVALLSIAFASKVSAQTFTAGNLSVLQVNGTSSSASQVVVCEYDPITHNQASPVNSWALPSTGGGNYFTLSGSASSDGNMTLDSERINLVVPGYNAASGTSNLVSSSGANRVIFTFDPSASYTMVANVPQAQAFNGNNFRSATGAGGRYYGAGAGGGSNGVRLMSGTTATAVAASGSTRVVQIFNGQLYYSLPTGVYMAGVGIPIASGAVSTLVANTTSAYGYAISPDNNTMYIADDGAGILKCTRTGGVGVFSTPTAISAIPCRGITVDFTVSPAIVYATTAPASGANALIRLADGSSTVDTLAVAATGTVFRGLTFSPGNSAKVTGGGANICSGTAATLTFYGNPGDSLTYTVNTVSNGLRLGNNGMYVLNTGALIANGTDSVYTFALSNITGSLGTVSVSGSTTITVSPSIPAAFTGALSVCSGGSFSLADVTPGGSWSASDPSIASINSATGAGTGGTAGSTTISYTASNVCGTIIRTASFTVNPLANGGIIGGPTAVCAYGTIILTNTGSIGTGSWSTSSSLATINSSTGVLTAGATAGSALITYTATTVSCGSTTITSSITINPLPNPGVISGIDSVCVGSTISLTSSGATGGSWVSANTLLATVSAGGTVGGAANGNVIIRYRVTTPTCGMDSVSKTIRVNPLPSAGIIGGPTSVCAGGVITLSNSGSIGTGSWSTGSLLASINSTTGVLTAGTTAGSALITYTATTASCGSTTITSGVTINALANPGTITGADSVCVGATISLASSGTGGGTWVSANTTIATVDASGNVHGVVGGSATIRYRVSTATCGSDSVSKVVVVKSLPVAGIISGPTSVCVGSSISLMSSGSVGAGSWSSSSLIVSIHPITGAITGITAGIAPITYTATNSCGSNIAVYPITVNALPFAGVISGADTLCPGAVTTLTTTGTVGGTWTSADLSVAVVSATSGAAAAVNTGNDVIKYNVTTATCGSDSATFNLFVRALPGAGTITGSDSVCVGFTLTLADAVTGGVWSSSPSTIATVSGGVVTGISAGNAIISYATTNTCGTSYALDTITVTPVVITPIIGGTVVCAGANISLSNATGGGTWVSTDATVAMVSATGVVTGIAQGNAVISYAVTNSCGLITDTQSIHVNPLPVAGTIVAASGTVVCSGSQLTLSNLAPGGLWSSGNTAVADVSPAGVVSGITNGSAVIYYTVFNSCGTAYDTIVVSVNSAPIAGGIPQITTTSPSWVCEGAMYQNFGTDSVAPAGTHYEWTVNNAQVYATGLGAQYCLINFPFIGTANIYLSTYRAGNICPVRDTFIVVVSNSTVDHPTISYIEGAFVSDMSQSSYQWGYDDRMTLEPTMLTGEINRNYNNSAPDFVNKYYWLISTHLLCQQKTYYSVPAGVVDIKDNSNYTVQLYPNPSNGEVSVRVSSPLAETGVITVTDVAGRELMTMPFEANNVAQLQIGQPAGVYLVTVRSQHIKYTTRVVVE